MLAIKNLEVSIKDQQKQIKPILQGVDLTLSKGKVAAIMGPNGSGKSTLANVLVGRDGYRITNGSVLLHNEDLLSVLPEERAAIGLFLAFQYPVEIPGVNNMYFIRTALNSLRKKQGQSPLDAGDFLMFLKQKLHQFGFDESLLKRAVNEGFSGGEKKRNEILQMLILEPSFIILDEIDSGLDIDALQMISKAVNSLRDANRSILMITHYQRLLDYIEPDVVHVMANGKIIETGDKMLAHRLEKEGYGWLQDA
ncbi:MAG: Fe-S cluster assembly ATPase SufC [Gammaproteobacteria bacterium RIFCSPHIGHO2_12_FULL_42_10]|nr:MAG: Fe-S cluster assembly ATPase SufC [Gammaproteobacteria bacterium RIFCSPHIGHO2_12_FULL_42_10]